MAKRTPAIEGPEARSEVERDRSLERALDPIAALELLRVMYRISEDGWRAGWDSGLSDAVEDIVAGGNGDPRFCTFSPSTLRQIRRLRKRAGGSWVSVRGSIFSPERFVTDAEIAGRIRVHGTCERGDGGEAMTTEESQRRFDTELIRAVAALPEREVSGAALAMQMLVASESLDVMRHRRASATEDWPVYDHGDVAREMARR